MSKLVFLMTLLCASTPLLGQESTPNFEREILPILKRSCFDCHGNPATDIKGRRKKPKGGVRLDAPRFILEELSSGDSVVAPGDPDSSLLFELVSLPADDDDLMPPEGGRLAEAELSLIKRWIAAGAPFADWKGSAAGAEVAAPVTTKPRIVKKSATAAVYEALGKGLKPLPAERLKAAAGEELDIAAVAAGSGLLSVSCSAREEKVTDEVLKRLASIADHIVELRLARSRVTDKGMKHLAAMPRLVHLDLKRTAVGDKGCAELSACKELRVLNLHDSEVGDAGLPHLVQLPHLESLYLWGSAATEKGIAVLQKRLPELQIVHRPRLPDPAPPGEGAGGRRRRGAN